MSGNGNTRKCSHCSNPLAPKETAQMDFVAAWLAGFCSPICQLGNAREKIKTGHVWWK